jgi:spore coat polysaccharide biosynthesis protein SpsF
MVIIATSDRPEDDVLAEAAKAHNVNCFRGSADDRLGRMLLAMEKFKADYIVTCDGDDLFCDPELINMAIDQMRNQPCDVIKYPSQIISGLFTFLASREALERAYKMRGNDETEMYDAYLSSDSFNIRQLENIDPIFLNGDWVRATLDYQEDLNFFKRVFDELKIDLNTVPFREIMALIERKPEIAEINYFRQKDFIDKRNNMRKKIGTI